MKTILAYSNSARPAKAEVGQLFINVRTGETFVFKEDKWNPTDAVSVAAVREQEPTPAPVETPSAPEQVLSEPSTPKEEAEPEKKTSKKSTPKKKETKK